MRPIRNTLPVNLIVDARPALVVGYGKVGQRKVKFLRECGVRVTVVAPDAEPDGSETSFLRRPFAPGDCKGAFVVFACTDDKHVYIICSLGILFSSRQHCAHSYP